MDLLEAASRPTAPGLWRPTSAAVGRLALIWEDEKLNVTLLPFFTSAAASRAAFADSSSPAMNIRSASPTVSSFSATAWSAGSSPGVTVPSLASSFALVASSTATSLPNSKVCDVG